MKNQYRIINYLNASLIIYFKLKLYWNNRSSKKHKPTLSVSYVKSCHLNEFLYEIINLFSTVSTDFIYFSLLLFLVEYFFC